MSKLTKETREQIKQYILDGITSEDVDLNTNKDKIRYAYNRFKSEYGHEIKRYGERKAFSNWLSGLSLDYDFYNCDILKLAKKWGQDVSTESKEDKIINQWWDFLTHQFFKLAKHYKIEVQ